LTKILSRPISTTRIWTYYHGIVFF